MMRNLSIETGRAGWVLSLSTAAVVMAVSGCALTGGTGPGAVVCACDDAGRWALEEKGGATASLRVVPDDGGKALELAWDFARPDFNSGKTFSGVTLELADPDFEIGPGEALAVRLSWDGGENHFKADLQDERGYSCSAEFTDLCGTKGPQDLLVSGDNLQWSGLGPPDGRLGRIRSLKLTFFYSWTPGPGRVVLHELRTVAKPEQPLVVAVSQLGYRPGDRKRVVVRAPDGSAPATSFRVVRLPETGAVLERPLEAVPFDDWTGQYAAGDFSGLAEEGRYQVEVRLGGTWYRSEVFSLRERLFDRATSRLCYEFLQALRADDPVLYGHHELGGYQDTGGMLARYLCTIVHLVYGMSHYVEAQGFSRDEATKIRYAIDELQYGVRSMLAWQQDDGSVVDAVIREPDLYPHNQFAADNTYPWKVVEGGASMLVYPAAMAAASRALAPYDAELASRALAAAKKTYRKVGAGRLPVHSGAIGGFLWDTMELYLATDDPAYLERARTLAAKLLERQFLDYTRSEGGVCGNLSFSGRTEEFAYQYKFLHEVGMYLGLIELAAGVDPSDPLSGDLRFFHRAFAERYLLRMASFTPYGQIAEGLERNEDGTFRVSYFHPPTGKLGPESHGLNCDHLAYALMAAELSRQLDDPRLEDFAADQVQWVFGVNPLGLSMMTGIGGRQGQSLEEYVGVAAIPGGIMNGIVGRNGTEPRWGRHWISGEYWIPHNAYYLAVLGELEGAARTRQEKETTTAALAADLEVPAPVSGERNMDVVLRVRNTSGRDQSATLILRARGSFALEESIPLELAPGQSRELTRSVPPAGRRAPCLVTVLTGGRVLGERFLLPEFPPYAPPTEREKLPRLSLVAAKASSIEPNQDNVRPENAIDGAPNSRWASEFSESEWIVVDLGAEKSVKKVVLTWEAAYGEGYEIQVSADGEAWTTAYAVDDEDGGRDEIALPEGATARFLRVLGTRRGLPSCGYSLYEIEVYGPS